MKFFLVNKLYFNVLRSGISFDSKKEAEEYQKKFKHIPIIADAMIVEGKSDAYGAVTPS